MRSLCIRSRLPLALTGLAVFFAAATLAGAQIATRAGVQADDGGICVLGGWENDRRLQPGEMVTLRPSPSCIAVGFGDLYDDRTWFLRQESGRLEPLAHSMSLVHEQGFTLTLNSDGSIDLMVSADAAPGPRLLRTAHERGTRLNRYAVIDRPFIIGGVDAQEVDQTRGFCCSAPGSPCETFAGGAVKGQLQCGDGKTWVPYNAFGEYDEKKEFCDYRICGVPGECLVSNAGSSSCFTISARECKEKRGEFHGDWTPTRCFAEAQTREIRSGVRDRFYCNPSAQISWINPLGDETEGSGVCRQVPPFEGGTYQPAGPGTLMYEPPGLPEYDSFEDSLADCSASCGYYYCVYVPVGNVLSRGCSNRPMRLVDPDDGNLCPGYDDTFDLDQPFYNARGDGTYVYPPYCPKRTGEKTLQNMVYTRHALRAGAHAYRGDPEYDDPDEQEDAFDTRQHCVNACPPCEGTNCLGVTVPRR